METASVGETAAVRARNLGKVNNAESDATKVTQEGGVRGESDTHEYLPHPGNATKHENVWATLGKATLSMFGHALDDDKIAYARLALKSELCHAQGYK